MGAAAARHARTVLGHVEQIVAIELAVRGPGAGPAAGAARGRGASARRRRRRARRGRRGGARDGSGRAIAPLGEDREPGPDLAAALALVHDGTLADLAGPGSVDSRGHGHPHRRRHRRRLVRAPAAVRRPGLRPPLLRLLGGRATAARRPRACPGSSGAPAPAPPPRPKPRNPFARDDDEPAFNPFAPGVDAARRSTRSPTTTTSRSRTRSPRAEGRARPSGGRARPSCGCSPAAWRSSAATRRCCCATTSPPPTPSSARCPPTRGRSAPASCTRSCPTRRCPR